MIRFIQNQYLYMGQINGITLNMVKQAAGTRGDDINFITEPCYLAANANSAIDGGAVYLCPASQLSYCFVGLFA